MYHLALVTKLLLNPNTNKKKAATKIVVIIKLLFNSMLLTLAMMIGISGISPNIQKLKNVTKLFLKGFYSSAMSCSSSIIMTLRNPYLF